MSSATAQTASTPSAPGYTPIHPRLVRLTDRVVVDLYIIPEGGGKPVLYCEGGLQLTPEQAAELRAGRREPLYVRNGDFQYLTQRLTDRLQAIMKDQSLPQSERLVVLQSAAAAQANHAFSLLCPNKFIGLAEETAANIVAMLKAGSVIPEELYRVARHDYSTFAHATNVSCYAVLLATALGMDDEELLRRIAVGGMLHDLGKRRIPAELLQKPYALSSEERTLIQSHPQRGYEDLLGRNGIGRDELMIVYQHHERLDGSGYPVGSVGDEIHQWARITAIVDVFDAMTSRRAYRDPDPPAAVLEHLQMHAGKLYDKEMVRCWTIVMQKA